MTVIVTHFLRKSSGNVNKQVYLYTRVDSYIQINI